MKAYSIGFLVVLALAIGCKTKPFAPSDAIMGSNQNAIAGTTANDTVRIANDSLEYEVIIIDSGFTNWLASRAKPRNYYGLAYLENKNIFWTTEWNSRILNAQRYGDLYQMRIDYSPQVKYGYEVNYLLFNYLVYFQVVNNQRLGGNLPQY